MGIRRAVAIASLATWGLAAAPASADGPPGDGPDPYVYAPPGAGPVPGFFDFKWSGFYVGGHLGGGYTGHESAETDVISPDPLLFETQTHDQAAWSVVGGVQAGWQKQWDKAVAGIEVTYSALSFDETAESPLVPGLTRSGEVRDLITLTGRLGYADGRWLAYAKGGWASAEIDTAYRDTLTDLVASSGGRENGWTAGVGIDYALSYNLFLGIEYNYLHFRADVPGAPIEDFLTDDADVDIQTLAVRLNYRFGSP